MSSGRGDPQIRAGRHSDPGGEALRSGRGGPQIRAGRPSDPGGEAALPILFLNQNLRINLYSGR